MRLELVRQFGRVDAEYGVKYLLGGTLIRGTKVMGDSNISIIDR